MFIVATDETFVRRVPAGNVLWGPNHFQTAESLTEAERAMFDVHELVEVERPGFNPMTHFLVEADPVKVAGVWTQVWNVTELSASDKAARLVSRKSDMRNRVDEKCADVMQSGYAHDFEGSVGEHTFQTRFEDETSWLALKDACNDAILAGMGDDQVALPPRTAANVNLTELTYNQVAAFLRGMRVKQSQRLGYSWALKDAISAAADHAALDAIDVESGWPA